MEDFTIEHHRKIKEFAQSLKKKHNKVLQVSNIFDYEYIMIDRKYVDGEFITDRDGNLVDIEDSKDPLSDEERYDRAMEGL